MAFDDTDRENSADTTSNLPDPISLADRIGALGLNATARIAAVTQGQVSQNLVQIYANGGTVGTHLTQIVTAALDRLEAEHDKAGKAAANGHAETADGLGQARGTKYPNGEDKAPGAQKAASTTQARTGHVLSAVGMFRGGLGPSLISVTPPDGEISPSSSLQLKHRGKAPGRRGPDGKWSSFDLNDEKFRCHDEKTALLWQNGWGANLGFVMGDGYIVVDNDHGPIFEAVLRQKWLQFVGSEELLLCRHVQDPGHPRSAFFFRVVDFIGDGAPIDNYNLEFEYDGVKGTCQILAHGKQVVIAGTHPGTRTLYLWNRPITSPSDIPVLSKEKFDQLIRGTIAEMKTLGWTLVRGGEKAQSGTSPGGRKTSAGKANPADYEEVKWLLGLLVNREVPPGETETPWDEYISVYSNWTDIFYAGAGALGNTPEARDLILDWSDNRVQPRQTSISVWNSVVRQTPRSNSRHLRELVKRFFPGEYNAHRFPNDEGEWINAEPDKPTKRFTKLKYFLAEYKPLHYVVDRLLAAGYVYMLTGPTSHGKTSFLVALTLAIATGRQDLLGLEVAQGRVAYLCLENAEDVRMRFAVAMHRFGIDPETVDSMVMIQQFHVSPEEVAADLKTWSAPENGGPFSLLIVDTLQAAFDGSDFNHNKEVLDFVKRQRRITGLPGKPANLIAAHPPKNSDKDNLVPYGGGAILNEIDGNLTIWKDANGVLCVHWQAKFRGLDFDQKPYELVLDTSPLILDDKGREVPMPVLLPLTTMAAATKVQGYTDTRTELLVTMRNNPTQNQTGWVLTMKSDKSTVSKLLKDLADKGLVIKVGGEGWVLTKKGRASIANIPEPKSSSNGQNEGDRNV